MNWPFQSQSQPTKRCRNVRTTHLLGPKRTVVTQHIIDGSGIDPQRSSKLNNLRCVTLAGTIALQKMLPQVGHTSHVDGTLVYQVTHSGISSVMLCTAIAFPTTDHILFPWPRSNAISQSEGHASEQSLVFLLSTIPDLPCLFLEPVVARQTLFCRSIVDDGALHRCVSIQRIHAILTPNA